MNSKHKLTQEEIAQAIKKFQASGGIINKLPEQRYTSTKYVGAEKSGGFETLSSFLAYR
jgi:hypothetical protein